MIIERYEMPPGMRLHPLRPTVLGMSEIACWAGHDPFKSRLQLWAEKTGLIEPQPDNAMMRRGRWLESAALCAVDELHPAWDVRKANVFLRAPAWRLGATPDAVVDTGDGQLTNLQLKVVSRPVFERDWANGPPLGYQLQTLGEAMLMDAPKAMIAALVIDTYSAELELFEVERHAAAEAKIVELADHFWSNIDFRPELDAKRDADVVAKLYAKSQPEPVLDLTGDNLLAELLPQRAALVGEMALDRAQLDQIDTEIKAKLGAHQIAELPGWRISWKPVTRKEHIVKESTFRVLRVTEIEEQEAAA
jgi:predicted phage-related endonuclease